MSADPLIEGLARDLAAVDQPAVPWDRLSEPTRARYRRNAAAFYAAAGADR